MIEAFNDEAIIRYIDYGETEINLRKKDSIGPLV